MNNSQSKHMSIGDWIITYILMIIPVVNVILLIVWAVNNECESKKNWARAAIILSIIGIVISVIAGIILSVVGVNLLQDYTQFN